MTRQFLDVFMRTHLSALQVPDAVAEMVIGHGRKGLQRVYDQHQYGDDLTGTGTTLLTSFRCSARHLMGSSLISAMLRRPKRKRPRGRGRLRRMRRAA
jgi:hypothetical protein